MLTCWYRFSADEELPDSILEQLGALMDASHESCATLCESSCPEVDELQRIAKDAGAYGSRITGAGWGGCTVSIVAEDRVEEFIGKVKARYALYKDLTDVQLREAIFATKPSSGAFGELVLQSGLESS